MAEQTSFDPEQYKERLRASWSAAAEAYAQMTLRQFNLIAERMIFLLELQKGQKILDVASGPGEPALSIAKALNGTGQVIGTDLAEGMVAQARKRAQAEGLKNVEFRPMDAEALQFSAGFFDRVTCRLGLMIFPHPDQALREMYRVLAKGGKVVLAVWGTEEKVRLIQLFRGVMQEHFPEANVPGAPLPFAFGIPGALEKAVKEAGFAQVRTEPLTVTPSFANAEELWETFSNGTPLKALLAQASPEVAERAKNSFLTAAGRYRNPSNGRIELPSEALLAAGIKT